MSGELVPQFADEDAAEVEDALGALEPPAHSRSVETEPDEVADCPFDSASADDEVALAQFLVAQAMALLEEVTDDLGESLTLAFVARPRLWDATERFAEVAEYDAVAPSAQQRLHLFHPRGERLGALGVEALAGLPDLLDDVGGCGSSSVTTSA